jgi:deazaflavin-dependent oxidoreductase (nitroreductase family)
MPLPRSFKDFGFRVLSATHRSIIHVSGGRIGSSAFGMPAVELFTVGRKSGKNYSTMLTAPMVDGDRIILVASKGGDDRDPDWYQNIVANPDVELILNGARRMMRARSADVAERFELWPRIIATYKPYGSYRRRTSRDIPIVICEPR